MKIKLLKSLFIFGAITFLTGCGEEAKTKEYYDNHLEEAKAKIEECNKLEKYNEIQQIDCQNAKSSRFNNKADKTNIYDTKTDMSDFVRPIPEDPYKKTTK